MKKLYDKYISKGTGVVIGEFGARIKKDNIQARTEFAAYYVAQARHYGMTTCWWDNNSFGGEWRKLRHFKAGKKSDTFSADCGADGTL